MQRRQYFSRIFSGPNKMNDIHTVCSLCVRVSYHKFHTQPKKIHTLFPATIAYSDKKNENISYTRGAFVSYGISKRINLNNISVIIVFSGLAPGAYMLVFFNL